MRHRQATRRLHQFRSYQYAVALQTRVRLMLVLAALLVYDIVLAIPDEVDLIWRRELGVSSAIFVLNRISVGMTVAFYILIDVNKVRHYPKHRLIPSHTSARCKSAITPYRSALIVQAAAARSSWSFMRFRTRSDRLQECVRPLQALASGHITHDMLVFSSMRVYAMSDRSILLAALVGVLGVAPLAVNLVGLRRDLYLGRITSDAMFPQWAISVESFFPLTHIFRGCALAVDVSEHAGFMYALLSARFA